MASHRHMTQAPNSPEQVVPESQAGRVHLGGQRQAVRVQGSAPGHEGQAGSFGSGKAPQLHGRRGGWAKHSHSCCDGRRWRLRLLLST